MLSQCAALLLQPGALRGLPRAAGFFFGLRAGGGLARGGRFAFIIQAFFVAAFHRQHAGILGGLNGFAGNHGDGFVTGFASLIPLGLGEQTGGLLYGVRRVLLRARRARDLQRAARFVEFQGYFRIDDRLRPGKGRILATLQQFKLGVDFVDLANGVGAENIFHHNDVAGLGDGEVRLGRYDEPKGLQFSGDVELSVRPVEQDLTEI